MDRWGSSWQWKSRQPARKSPGRAVEGNRKGSAKGLRLCEGPVGSIVTPEGISQPKIVARTSVRAPQAHLGPRTEGLQTGLRKQRSPRAFGSHRRGSCARTGTKLSAQGPCNIPAPEFSGPPVCSIVLAFDDIRFHAASVHSLPPSRLGAPCFGAGYLAGPGPSTLSGSPLY